MNKIKVMINGVHGKMGSITKSSIGNQDDFILVASTGRGDHLADVIHNTEADVVIDFTVPESVYNNTMTIINCGARPVIGTSGLTMEQIETLKTACHEKKLGGIIAPNFALGCILLMKYAKDAARYLPQVEIIEMHHEKKLDAPSGTAIKTAQMISTSRASITPPTSAHYVSTAYIQNGIPIHSIRLSGIFAQQTVLFGGKDETLTITQNSLTRHSMLPGVFLACKKVISLHHLVYGLEKLL